MDDDDTTQVQEVLYRTVLQYRIPRLTSLYIIHYTSIIIIMCRVLSAHISVLCADEPGSKGVYFEQCNVLHLESPNMSSVEVDHLRLAAISDTVPL